MEICKLIASWLGESESFQRPVLALLVFVDIDSDQKNENEYSHLFSNEPLTTQCSRRNTYRNNRSGSCIYLPSARVHLPPQHSILLPPESVGTECQDKHTDTNANNGQRNSEDKVSEDFVGIWGMLKPE